MTGKRVKKWKVVLIVEESWNREAGWLTRDDMFRAVKTSLDLPPDIEFKNGGASELSKV